MILTDHERAILEEACAGVPPPAVPPAVGTDADYPDYITNLLLTVLDLRLLNVIVNNAIEHYRAQRWDEIRTLDDLQTLLARFPDDVEGNRAAAAYLWGYRYRNQLGHLRGLVSWARESGLTDQDRLRTWAHQSNDPKSASDLRRNPTVGAVRAPLVSDHAGGRMRKEMQRRQWKVSERDGRHSTAIAGVI